MGWKASLEMSIETDVEVELLLHGPEALERATAEAREFEERGDHASLSRALRKVELIKDKINFNEMEQARKKSTNPNEEPLFGGLTRIVIPEQKFEISAGLYLESVYAHVMAPYLVAFSPAQKGKPHPPPWMAASGGIALDIQTQLVLEKGAQPTNFDRLNTLWWIVALIRLQHAVGLRAPLVSNVSLSECTKTSVEPVFWPIELDNRGLAFDGFNATFHVPLDSLDWIRLNFQAGAELMKLTNFRLAFLALDSAQRAASLAEAMILAWSSIESFFRPGQPHTTHKVSLSVATYLESGGPARDALYGKSKALYEARGRVTHAAEPPLAKDVVETFKIARRCLQKAIEVGEVPQLSELQERWRQRQ